VTRVVLQPPVRQQVVQRVTGGSPSQLFKAIAQISPRLHLIQLTASHQRHQHRCKRPCFDAPHKKPVLPPDRHRLHQPLGRIVVDRQATILHITVQRCPLIPGLPRRLARRTLRQEQLAIHPSPKLLQQRDRILLPKLSPFLVWLPLGELFDVVKPLDQADHPVRARRIDLPGLLPTFGNVPNKPPLGWLPQNRGKSRHSRCRHRTAGIPTSKKQR
jgi:hypothetical protein